MQLGYRGEPGTEQRLQGFAPARIDEVGIMGIAVYDHVRTQFLQEGEIAFVGIEYPEAAVGFRVNLYQVAAADSLGQVGADEVDVPVLFRDMGRNHSAL